MRGVLLVLGLLLAGGEAGASGIDTLLAAVVNAYGGPAAVQKLETFRVEADVQSMMQGLGRARRDFQAPDRLRVEIAYSGATEVRVLDGDKGWRGDATRLGRVDGAPRLAMVYQMLRSTVPESLTRHRALLVDRGAQSREGAEYRVLALPWSKELDLTFWIDPKDHRVTWVEGGIRTGPLTTNFATQYKDFRTVDGVLVPFVEENYASGQHTGTTTVRAVRFAPADLGPFDPTHN
ncbi:MAG: hypothetical protein HZB55_01375 [Deltaproteobacteria bacterium]|nr:hypothetical protein [Deltaproteobacteria bacterium]